MCNRYPTFVRANEADIVRRWADLEGKSATMREELYRRFVPQYTVRRFAQVRFDYFAELIAALVNTWWHIRSR